MCCCRIWRIAGVALLRREVHSAAALVVLQGRGGAGGQQQTHRTFVSFAARSVEGGLTEVVGQVDDSAAPKEQIHRLRAMRWRGAFHHACTAR
jgi:hypothetical protein